jgi:molybdopterin-guanine dinucleotide biosynthesis protein MobB
MRNNKMKYIPIISFVGYSNSGKTTLIRKILEKLSHKYKIGIIKHHGHPDDKKNTGSIKDTDVFINAGAKIVRLLIGDVMPEDTIEEYRKSDLDLIIIEGYKKLSYPKFYIKRENIKEIYYNEDEVLGIISDDIEDKSNNKVWFNINDVDSIVDFIKNSFLKGD